MKSKLFLFLGGVCALAIFLTATSAQAQQHRATRLGIPGFRFADPITTPEGLRALFSNPRLKPDIASVLDQWGWQGDLADLHHAAATAEVSEVKVPTGTRLPFMSTRKNGKPVALFDVLWAGKEPIDAYVFVFSSKGQRYRCVTPKLCSNFFLEPLGPELVKPVPPQISIHFEVVDLEDPIEVGHPVTYDISVLNQGTQPITNIRLLCLVPSNQEYVSGTGVTPVTAQNQKVWLHAVPVLAGKAVVRWRVIVKAIGAGDTRFKVECLCDQITEPFVRSEATQQY